MEYPRAALETTFLRVFIRVVLEVRSIIGDTSYSPPKRVELRQS